ncbi:sugar phosphate isomerase/epimerase [Friedmanniella endophytica]|uniref:Sugar phosphate isomerase/epimerase n=1 Tax=Microlunatus kandeliicorticis TaxID=1759536 RepID=A0A7W3IPA2_9ACTN|nr:sugar phosphate isomerase/epimerase [Microlunatus kandeliicorticis]MBA8792744.1 sugar phosphate isomerase/epimerase [Microlunatus kandeliicorticis]
MPMPPAQDPGASAGDAEEPEAEHPPVIKVSPARIGLSTSSVYPETTSSAFELSRRLGYDGIELMVGIDPVAADIDAVEKLRDYHGVPVLSVHAPCLLITQRVWGTDHWEKLRRSAEAAKRLDADVVVVHPPFRWQREYARGFVEGVRRLTEETGILISVENMYPWRTPGGEFKAYLPGWDPTERDYDHLTLDLSHASTANQQSLELARSWGSRLRHLHLTDGTGSIKDEHLNPGEGDQKAGEVLEFLAGSDFAGHVVLEVNSRKAESRARREEQLAEALAFTRLHLASPVHSDYAVDSTGTASAVGTG